MPSPKPFGPARSRQMDALWNRFTFLVGCGAIVGIVASLTFVISQRVLKPVKLDEEALAVVVDSNSSAGNWSGKVRSAPSLMDSLPSPKQTGGVVALPAVSTPAPAIGLNAAISGPPSELPPSGSVVSGIENMDGKRVAIAAAVEAFFKAQTIESKLERSRDPVRVKPLMVSYYAREPMPVWKWRGLGKLFRVEEPGYRFGFVQALFDDATPASVVIEETADGRFLVDWEGFVRYGELGWADFLRIRPVEPKLLRVIASKVAGSAGVADQASPTSQWLELRHPAETGSVLGCFNPTDPKYASLVEQLELGKGKDVPLTLRLCFPTIPSRLDGTGVQIAGVEGKGWLILDESKPHG